MSEPKDSKGKSVFDAEDAMGGRTIELPFTPEKVASSANDRQEGGAHYKDATLQHWDYAWIKFGRGYFQGNISKYVERYHKKGGLEDLLKARHYLEKLIELEYGPTPKS